MIVGAASTIAAVVPTGSAEAAVNQGVDYVNFSSDPCGDGGPCLATPGSGPQTIRVQQTEVAPGQYEFTDVMSGFGDLDGVLMQTRFGGKCNTNYRLDDAAIYAGMYHQGSIENPDLDSPLEPWKAPISVNTDNKTMSDRTVSFLVPWGDLFQPAGSVPGNVLQDFDSIEHILEYAETRVGEIAQEEGKTEAEVRDEGFKLETDIIMTGALTCRQWAFGNKKWSFGYSDYLSVEMYFAGLDDDPFRDAELEEEPTPSVDPDPAPDLKTETSITQAFVSVEPKHDDPCKLSVSGAVTATEPTELEYRIVDELGVKSNIITAEIDHTQTYMFAHEIDLPVVEVDDGGGLVANPEARDLGDLVVAETDREQGTYHIEITTPHFYESNVAGYNVEPCFVPIGSLQIDLDPVQVDPGTFEPTGELVVGQDFVGDPSATRG